MSTLRRDFAPGVIVGNEVKEVFALAKAEGFALPAANVTGSNTMNAAMETAAKLNSPMIIQFSYSGAAFIAGKGIAINGVKGDQASIAGALAGAAHVNAPRRGVRRPDHPAHRSLRQGQARVGRRPARRRRGALRRARPSAVLLAHARPVRGADGGERRHLQALPRADGGHRDDARARARHHRWRGGRRRQHRGRPGRPVLQAGGGRLRLHRAVGGERPVHDRRGVRQRPRRLQAGQREAAPDDPARQPGVHRRPARPRAQAGRLRVPRRVGVVARRRSPRRSRTAW